MTYELQITIWRNVAAGVGGHGDFLKSFANAYVRADAISQRILASASVALIKRFKLDEQKSLTSH